MATNWYDPTGSSAGFYNSPQDFLFKSGGGDNTWYGQGPAGQDNAAQMPTAQDYYFGAPQQQQTQAPTSFSTMNMGGGGVTPQGYNAGTPARGGGLNISYDSNVPVPVGAGPLWSRYQAVQANPEILTADPAYQFAFNQGQEALNRTAASKRMRFAGKTMLDAQQFGQGLAAQNFKTMLGELRAGAGDEYSRDQYNARAKAAATSSQTFAMDPYGVGRKAMAYRNPSDYYASLPGANIYDPSGARYAKAEADWMLGQQLKKLQGG